MHTSGTLLLDMSHMNLLQVILQGGDSTIAVEGRSKLLIKIINLVMCHYNDMNVF